MLGNSKQNSPLLLINSCKTIAEHKAICDAKRTKNDMQIKRAADDRKDLIIRAIERPSQPSRLILLKE